MVGSLRSESSSKSIICSRVSQQFHDFVNASFKHMRRGPSTRLQETYFGPVDGVSRQTRRILGFGRGSWCTTKCLATKLATRRHATRLAISSEASFVTWEQMFHSMLLRTKVLGILRLVSRTYAPDRSMYVCTSAMRLPLAC